VSAGQRIGYARVSSYGQKLDVQLDKLKADGCTKIFQEKRSGRDAKNRPELQRCLEYVRDGDALVVCKLDRLARSVIDLHQTAQRLEQQGVGLVVLDQTIDTTTPTGRLTFSLLGAVAEFENDLRKERQLEGIAKAKEQGVQFGPKAKLSDEQVVELRATVAANPERTKAEVAEEFGISRASLYRLLAL
jgi:DNA invertase Pin-like site-specific DNA recombinase